MVLVLGLPDEAATTGEIASCAAGVLEIADGARLEYAPPWTRPAQRYANQPELQLQAAAAGGPPRARLVVQTERRLDHEDALRRLSEIAAERRGAVSVLAIDGWPAVRRRYREPLARTGPQADSPAGDAPLRLTAAIASGAHLIRFEAQILAAEVEEAVAIEIERQVERTRFDRQLTPAQLERELAELRGLLGQE